MTEIKNIPPKNLAPGITGYYIHGEKHSLGRVELKKDSLVPLHSHIHEQITYVLEGRLMMMIGEQEVVLTPGMYRVIPSGVLHSANAIEDCILIDSFSPVREDYRTQ